jgi:PadR family transcriptional regulator, regulatory protein PadR
MKTTKRTNPDFLNGVPELLILQLLKRQPMYGYELVQNIRLRSGAVLEFGEGCIYPVLHRLEREGAVLSQKEEAGGRWRVVYRLTPLGDRRLAEGVTLWQRLTGAVRLMLEGESLGQTAHA